MNINLESQARKQALADITEELRRENRLFMAVGVDDDRIVVKILKKDPGTPYEYYLNDTACRRLCVNG